MNTAVPLGLGIGWRPEIALLIDRRTDLGFVEVVAEELAGVSELPAPLERLLERRLSIIPHGVGLSLGGAEPPDRERLDELAQAARLLDAPIVSEHIAFVRSGGLETGHLLPVPRTWEALDIVVSNVKEAQAVLPVPLALENIATLFEWPDDEMDEAAFLTEVLERTDALLLLDLANLYANARNHGYDARRFLDRIPLRRLAYVHVAGGIERGGLYHDTHGAIVPPAVLELLGELRARVPIPGVMLERDDCFPSDEELSAELDAIAAASRGRSRVHVG